MRYIGIIIVISLLMSNTKKASTCILIGKYTVSYTQNPGEMLLTRYKDQGLGRGGFQKISFQRGKFLDARHPSCGNDIIWNKTGKYRLVKNKLVLDYTGGELNDNTGADEERIYKKGIMTFQLRCQGRDSIYLQKISGVEDEMKLRISKSNSTH